MRTGVRFLGVAMFLSCILSQLFGQNQLTNPDVALEQFNKGEYNSAFLTYEYLLGDYPKDAIYNYYAGVCLFYINHSNEKAVGYLSLAARYDVPVDVYYYLGRLHHNTCRFDEAIKYYEKYNSLASKKEVKSSGSAHLIEMAGNGTKLTNNRLSLTATLKDTVKHQDIAYAVKTFSHYTTMDTKNAGKNLSYSGTNPVISSINTPYDEDYGYYDESSRTLYFSSKGHNSMGGYDAFSMQLNKDNSWSDVKNMGFPVNSPYDEILYVKDDKLILATNRTMPLYTDEFIIYEINIYDYSPLIISSDSIAFYSDLANSSANKRTSPKNNGNKGSERKLTFEDTETELAYDDYIRQALKLQFKSDSLMREAQKNRNQLKVITLQAERTQLFRAIRLQEAESAQLKIQADALYAKAGNIESGIPSPSADNENEYIELDTIINDIKVYNYKPDKLKITEAAEKKPVTTNEQETEITVTEQPEITKVPVTTKLAEPSETVTSFEILPASRYSATNPIPMDKPLPMGVVYKIQLGVFSKPVDMDYFGGISPISGEEMKERGLIKYYAGIFTQYKAASEALSQIKNKDFVDAFVVSYYNGKKVSVERAIELEILP